MMIMLANRFWYLPSGEDWTLKDKQILSIVPMKGTKRVKLSGG